MNLRKKTKERKRQKEGKGRQRISNRTGRKPKERGTKKMNYFEKGGKSQQCQILLKGQVNKD